jgi:luciferase family oxidoreductase group 1
VVEEENMGSEIAVSVHDTVPVWEGDTTGEALGRTLELAQATESLGYHRYWLAEHHGTPALATSSPPVLAGPILERTARIRVGAGVVLLSNHSPLVVAEQFGILSSLYPDRVDLGLGRAAGGPLPTAGRLGDPRRLGFAEALGELREYFAGGSGGARAIPEPTVPPELWMVGSSIDSAEAAGRLGLPYAYAHAIVGAGTAAALAAYRAAFRPSPLLAAAYPAVAIIAVLADTETRAHELATPFVLGQILMRTGDPDTVLPSERRTAEHHFTAPEVEFLRQRIGPQFIGTPETVGPRLGAFLRETGSKELFVLTQVPDHQARIHSYELLTKVVAAL